MENWRILGCDPTDAKGLIQILYRATAKTFQSPRIMRYLIETLEGSGDYIDAERSLDAYIFIIETQKRTAGITRKAGNGVKDSEMLPDVDSDEDILKTIAKGIRILVKFLDNGKKAMELARKLEKYTDCWGVTFPETLAIVYHAIGTANAMWAIQSTSLRIPTNIAIDADSRVSIQLTAVTAYTTALSHVPNKLESYYQLAIQYARQRNIEKSISALSQALRLNKFHIPSIHLLTLVLTSLDDYEKALQTCHTIKFDHAETLELDDAIALMELQLTYLRIVEAVSGKDLALEIQKGVFKLYNRMFGPVMSAGKGYIKPDYDFDFPSNNGTEQQSLRRTQSNINPEKKHLHKSSIAGESMESKTSLRVGRTKSLLRRKQRSRSVDASTSRFSSEHLPDSTSYPTQLILGARDSPPPVPSIPELLSPDHPPVIQKIPNHASDIPSKFTAPPSIRKQHMAKVYRAKLWLACAGIYRRAMQWEGAQAAIQDALLCDTCQEEVYTEVSSLQE